MNALGGIAWATIFGVGAYLFGAQVAELGGGIVGGVLLVGAIIAVIAGIVFVRHHEEQLIKQAEIAIPGPLADHH
jgi:membrane protein DedA with SNARE-associated domain